MCSLRGRQQGLALDKCPGNAGMPLGLVLFAEQTPLLQGLETPLHATIPSASSGTHRSALKLDSSQGLLGASMPGASPDRNPAPSSAC